MSRGSEPINNDPRRSRGRPWAPVALGAWLLAACTGAGPWAQAWDLEGHPGLLLQVKQFYEARGRERNGICKTPLLDGVSRSEVISDDGEQLMIALRYYFRDTSGREFGIRRCRGFGQRTFTIARQATDAGETLQVVAMTGEQTRRPFPSSQ